MFGFSVLLKHPSYVQIPRALQCGRCQTAEGMKGGGCRCIILTSGHNSRKVVAAPCPICQVPPTLLMAN